MVDAAVPVEVLALDMTLLLVELVGELETVAGCVLGDELVMAAVGVTVVGVVVVLLVAVTVE